MELAPDLVDSYLLHFVAKDPSLDWAFDELLDVMDSAPERAWTALARQIIRRELYL